MLLTQSLLPHLRAQREAQVLCIGSALGRLGLPGYSVYSASKFGLRGFAEALRRELADTTVRVKYLGPRSTRTAFNERAVEDYNRATGTAMDPPEQVARALRSLLEGDGAEAFVGFPEKLAVRLNGVVPTWLDAAFTKHRAQLPPIAAAPAAPSSPSSDNALTGQAT
jgi:short-subunit dehydrogenase